MATLWKHPNSSYWTAMYIDADGKRVKRSTKQADKKAAQRVADEFEAAVGLARSGELTQAAAISAISRTMEVAGMGQLKTPSIQEAFDNWFSDLSTKKPPVSEPSIKRYKGVMKSFYKFLTPVRLKSSVRSLTAAELESWRDREMADGKSGTTADYGINVIRGAMNRMHATGLLTHNEAKAVRSSGVAPETRKTFSDDQVRQILAVCNKEWEGMVLFSAWHSLRLGDAASLTWGNIDMERYILSFVPQKTRNDGAEPLTLCLAHELVTYLNSIKQGVGMAPIFPSLHGRASGSYAGLSNEFKSILDKAGVVIPKGKRKAGKGRQFAKLGFHSFRHFSISRMADTDIPDTQRRMMAAHSVNSTAHISYLHMNEKSQRAALAKLSPLNDEKKAS